MQPFSTSPGMQGHTKLFHSALLVSKSHAALRNRTYISELCSPGVHVIKQLPIHHHSCPNLWKGHYYTGKPREFLRSKTFSDANFSTSFKSRLFQNPCVCRLLLHSHSLFMLQDPCRSPSWVLSSQIYWDRFERHLSREAALGLCVKY